MASRLIAPPRETVTIEGHEVLCPCGCVWIAAPQYELNPIDNACPDCRKPAAKGRVGPIQPFTVTVPLAFRGAARIPSR